MNFGGLFAPFGARLLYHCSLEQLENRAHLTQVSRHQAVGKAAPKPQSESLLCWGQRAAMPTDPAELTANFGTASTAAEGAFSMPVFAKTICSTLKPSHMPRHRWVKGLFFLFESQCLWTAAPAKEFL